MKKIFTLIAVAMAAVSVNAQTTVDFKGLLPAAFTYESGAYIEEAWAEKDENDNATGKSYNSFTYAAADGVYHAIELTGKNMKFNYKNSSQKDNFFILHKDYFMVGGKGVQFIISGLTKGQKVTLKVAAKSTGAAPGFGVGGGALVEGDASAVTSTSDFASLTYKVTAANGEVTVTNGDGGYKLESVTIAEGEAEATIDNPTPVKVTLALSDPADLTAAVAEPADAMTKVEVATGEGLSILEATQSYGGITFIKLQPTGSDKGTNSYANAKELKKYIDIKFTPSALFALTKVSFDIIKIGTGDPQAFYDIIDGEGLENSIAGPVDIRRNKDDDATSINQSYEATTSPSTNPITLRIYIGKLADNKQAGLANVVIEGNYAGGAAGIANVKAADEQNGTVYNLAGQKVNNSYNGVVIMNGKKVLK
jgi:hypothetical protein